MKDATEADVDSAVQRAERASRIFAADREKRAQLLERIADNIDALGDGLLACASEESQLPLARLQGERGRTTSQLKLFATVVREGSYLGLRLDSADRARQPLPKPDLRRMLRPLGPVAIFGASNFPLAFSVAGGDTASALAAGCPVLHKAHPAHPKTAAMVGEAIAAAVGELGLPEGVFALLQGESHQVGQWLVCHPGIHAIGFTGSLRAGRALFDLAAARKNPIPVYAEMGSVNPVFLLPAAVAVRGEAIAAGLAGSVTMGVGQFCTNPGLIFVVGNEEGERLIDALAEKLDAAPAGKMLYPAICRGYQALVEKHAAQAGVEKRTKAAPAEGQEAMPTLLVTCAATFAKSEGLQEEVFGPATLVVKCQDATEMVTLAESLEGQLTATIQAEANQDDQEAAKLLEILAGKAGRIVWNGYPTGVEVGQAMQHGGPYPATTDSRSTSVGTAAIDRFLRPVAYQDVPEHLLPKELSDPVSELRRLENGRWSG